MSKVQIETRILHEGIETTSNNGDDLTVFSEKVSLYLNVTDFGGTSPVLDVNIEELDPVSGKYFLRGAFASKTGNGSERIEISFVAPNKVRAIWLITGSGGQTFTFTIGLSGKYLK